MELKLYLWITTKYRRLGQIQRKVYAMSSVCFHVLLNVVLSLILQ